MKMNFLVRLCVAGLLLCTTACQTIERDEALMQGNQYAKDGLYREALDSYKKSYRKNPKNPTLVRNMGMVYFKVGDIPNAIKMLETAVVHYEDDFETNYYLGEAYRSDDRYSEAIFRYQNALKLTPQSVKTKKSLAWSFYQIRYYSEALKLAKDLYQDRKNDLQANVILARVYLKLNQIRSAKNIITLAKANLPADSHPYLAAVEGDIAQAQGNCKAGIQYYQTALKSQPLMPLALIGMGACLISENKADPATKFLERAQRIQPKHAIIYYLLGQAYEGKKDPRSLQYYRKFVALAKNDPEYIAKVSMLQQRLRTASK